MNTIKKVAVSAKKFVVKHKTVAVITLTTLVLAEVGHRTIQAHDDFLKEHDLYEKFYNSEN